SLDPLTLGAGDQSVLVLTQPVHLGSHWAATVSAAFSERQFAETVSARLFELQRRLSGITAAAVFCGLLFAFCVAHSWTRPIHALAQAATLVGQGRYRLELSAMSRRHDELGYLAGTFESMANDLCVLDQMKEDFVSSVTHELRSPLSAIESYLN